MEASAQFKQYLDIAWRRKWWIVVPAVLSVGVAAGLLYKLPKTYRASTTILVTPQRVPEEFVRSTVTTQVAERMASLSVQILSRSFLEKVVKEFGLAAEEASDAVVEQACARLKGRVDVSADRRSLSYFEVSVEDSDPERSAGVANRLAGLFIEQNSIMRSEQATGTRSTLGGWLEGKKEELDSVEERIAAYKKTYLWELPEQMSANLQLLETARERFASTNNDIQLREDRLKGLRAQARLNSRITAVTEAPEDADPAARRLAELESELAQLRVSYTEENPAVKKKLAEIAEFRRTHPGPSGQPLGPDEGAPETGIRGEIAQVESEVRTLEQDRDRLKRQIDVYTSRINNTPVRQQELASLTRDHETLQREYIDLKGKFEQAERAEDLEDSHKSEQFRIQDPARVPTVPFRPDPLQIGILCLMLGLGVGVGATFLLEFLDQTLRTESEFRVAFPDLPLLGTLPQRDSREHRRRRKSGGRHAAVLVLLLALLAVVGVLAVRAWEATPW